ncbi:gluconolactonase [Echinicola soli]|uniref:Gluconolactonase n=2 Tax=Echinicola soli TaxID=2591634 RepID=A0A514CPG5_9BACT|nr:gluconolactonase [Echinicola soli]
MVLSAMAILGCDNDDVVPQSSLDPFLYTMAPVEGNARDVVTIQGRNFSRNREKNVVSFNGVSAKVLEASNSRLQVVVPEGKGPQTIEVSIDGVGADGALLEFIHVALPANYMVSTLAGNSDYGLVDGMGNAASFRNPEGVAVHPDGYLIVTDRTNNSIRQVSFDGSVTTVLGTGQRGYLDGPVAGALLDYPWKSCVDKDGNIYIADRDNHVVRKIDPRGAVSTVAGTGVAGFNDGAADQAQFDQPLDVAVSEEGVLYVADNRNHRIRRIDVDGTVSTVTGSEQGNQNGNLQDATFRYPSGLDIDGKGNIFVADRINHLIRKIDLNAGQVSTVAGDGSQGTRDGQLMNAQFNNPYGITVTDEGNLVIADLSNHKIRLIDEEKVLTIAGSVSGFLDGVGRTAQFYNPTDVTSHDGHIYVADLGNHRVRKIEQK